MAFGPIIQSTTPDAVLTVLRKAILSGDLAPGTQLRETHISGELGISRAPLREALATLEEEGLVQRIPFRGAFVAEVSHERIDEISAVRRVLEPFAIELGLPALRARVEEMREQSDELRAAAEAKDVPRALNAHLALHRQFYEAAGSSVLQEMWQTWESQLRLFLAEDLRRFRDPLEMSHEHDHLITLIEKGDMTAIRVDMVGHIHDYPRPECEPT